MSQNQKKNKAKLKIDKPTIVIIVCLIIITIPFMVLGYFLFSASLNTGTPIIGDRFLNDLNPVIKTSEIEQIESSIKDVTNVERVEIVLKTATLRVYVDTKDDAEKKDIEELAKEIYTIVTTVLDENTYFTKTNEKKMYDLEIHVYNLDKNRDTDDFIYVIVSKSSSMSEYISQVVSEPKNPELAQRLLDETEARLNPTPTPDEDDVTVGGNDDETDIGEDN